MMQAKCPECKKNLDLGHKFCGGCGNMLDCPECDRYRTAGTAFCGGCGRRFGNRYAYVPEDKKNGPVFWASLFATGLVMMFLAVEGATLFIKFADVFVYAAGIEYDLLILLPSPHVFLRFSGAWSQAYWVFLVVAILLSFARLAWEIYSKHTGRGPEESVGGLEDTSAYWLGLFWPSTIVIQLAIMLLAAAWSGAGLPSFETYDENYMMFVLASASVWEEIITRVLIIGLPLAAFALISKKERPARYLLGGFGVSKAAMILIIISSAVFGYAHYDGWGTIKILPSFMFGLAAGYLYSRYGLYASILLHFANDYMQSFLWLGMGEGLMSILIMMLLGLGIVTTVILTVKGVPFARGFRHREFFPDSFKKD
jgi:hypothetical protein